MLLTTDGLVIFYEGGRTDILELSGSGKVPGTLPPMIGLNCIFIPFVYVF